MNDILLILLIVALLISNAIFIFLFIREKKRKAKIKTSSGDSSELLRDLIDGEALIKITRIAPTDVFLRSPRHGG